jgi:hypothetical protein
MLECDMVPSHSPLTQAAMTAVAFLQAQRSVWRLAGGVVYCNDEREMQSHLVHSAALQMSSGFLFLVGRKLRRVAGAEGSAPQRQQQEQEM